MNRTCVLMMCAAAAPCAAQQSVSIGLAGLQFRHQTNQTRSSAPSIISPAFRYTYAITGSVRGVNGALGLLYPNPTPIATVLETLAPGSSANLSGQFDNCAGSHPIAPAPQTTSGTSTVSGIQVSYAFTLATSIDATGAASFSVTNVTLSPSILIGYLQFTDGTSVITRVNHCPANCDGQHAGSGPDGQRLHLLPDRVRQRRSRRQLRLQQRGPDAHRQRLCLLPEQVRRRVLVGPGTLNSWLCSSPS